MIPDIDYGIHCGLCGKRIANLLHVWFIGTPEQCAERKGQMVCHDCWVESPEYLPDDKNRSLGS